MSAGKHTPGPLEADDEPVGGSHDRHTDWYGVCLPADALGRQFTIALAAKRADAVLYAAAPDLLAALEELLPIADAWAHDIGQEKLRKARAAIAKAVGK